MVGQLLSSKIVVVEEEPRVRGIPSAPTAVVGAIGITERGPIGQATLVTSFEEFETKFGGFTADSDLALAAMGFFENGGSQLWVVRTVHHTDITDPGSATAVRGFGYLVSPGAPTPAVIHRRHPGTAVARRRRRPRALGERWRRRDRNLQRHRRPGSRRRHAPVRSG